MVGMTLKDKPTEFDRWLAEWLAGIHGTGAVLQSIPSEKVNTKIMVEVPKSPTSSESKF
jgi:hypothetical protein